MYTSYPLGIAAFWATSIATVTLSAPSSFTISPISSGRRNTAEEVDTLSAPAFSTSSAATTELIPPPMVNGTVLTAATFFTTSSIVARPCTVAVMSSIAISSAPAAQYALQHSTGSPASLMSTKLTPFTTRPFIMSRHGIITSCFSIGFPSFTCLTDQISSGRWHPRLPPQRDAALRRRTA